MKFRILIVALSLVGMAFSQDLSAGDFVTDFANILPDDQEKALSKKLSDFEKKTTIEFAVVTVDNLNGEDVSSFTNELFREWGVGKEGKNNGLLILIAPNERKWRIEVGYGLEEYLTDGYTKTVAEEHFKEHFRAGDYIGGITPVADDFMQRMGEKSWPEREAEIEKIKKEKAEFWSSFWSIFLYSVLGLIIILLLRYAIKLHIRNKEARIDQERRVQEALIRSENEERQRIQNGIAQLRSRNTQTVEVFKALMDRAAPLASQEELNSWDHIYSQMREINAVSPITSIEQGKEVNESLQILEEGVLSRINHLVKIQDDLDLLRMNHDTFKAARNKLVADFNEFIAFNDHSKYKIDFRLEPFQSNLALANKAYNEADSKMTVTAYLEAQELQERYQRDLHIAKNYLNDKSRELFVYENAAQYVKTNERSLKMMLLSMKRSLQRSDVTPETLREGTTAENLAGLYTSNLEKENVLDSKNRLENIVSRINSVTSRADNDVNIVIRRKEEQERQKRAEEERKRREQRRRQEEEEESERRRRNSYSSSSVGYGSSSSSSDSGSSFGGFGGGDSGGGGSSGDW